jgi:HK97 family phage major capsid protein
VDINSHVKGLNETRMSVWSQLQAELDATAGRERNEEEKAKIARLDVRLDEIDAEIREFVARETKARESAELRASALSLIGEHRVNERDKREAAGLTEWLRSGGQGEFEIDIRAAAKERQLLRQGASPDELRAMSWDATSGSLVVPTTLARSLFEYLEASIAGFRVGAMQVNTSTGENMQLPTLKTHAIGTQTSAQQVAFGGSEPVFARVNLNAYKFNNYAAVSNELLRDSVFDVGAFLGRDMGYALGRIIDADLIVGTGTNEPTGMTVLAGSGTNAPITTGGSLIPPTIEKYIDLVYSVNDAARESGKWLLRDSTAGSIRKLRDGAGGTIGAFLWQPSLTQGVVTGQPDRFLGYPVFTDPNCAAAGSGSIVATFGDFSQYALRTVGNPVIERSDDFLFSTDAAAFRGKWTVGGNHTQVSHLNNLQMAV